MNVIRMTTADQGSVQVDLDTGFCIYEATLGKAAGTLMPVCLDHIRETGLDTRGSLVLEFETARMTEGKYVAQYDKRDDNQAALELSTSMVRRAELSAELADA